MKEVQHPWLTGRGRKESEEGKEGDGRDRQG
jgi:hypothetical protein